MLRFLKCVSYLSDGKELIGHTKSRHQRKKEVTERIYCAAVQRE